MAHTLDSALLYIHPPLAIAAYVAVVLALVWLFLCRPGAADHAQRAHRAQCALRWYTISLRSAWVLTLLGLVTGMIWAHAAWGAYWSWDPKETATLVLFSGLSAQLLLGPIGNEDQKASDRTWRVHLGAMVVNCALVGVTIAVGFIVTGLHSYLGL